MQKIFVKYTVIIITGAVFLILFINFLFSWRMLESQQAGAFRAKIEQIIHTLENNKAELALMNENLDEDYLTRAKAAAYVLDHLEEVMDVSEMQYLAKLLNVDELHYIDESGMIVAGSVSKYVGMNMADHDQTSAFLVLLDRSREQNWLIQEARPNAAEGKNMQYIGVAGKRLKGFIQVGFEPKRLMEAQSRNTYDYIFSRFPTDAEEEFFAVDGATGAVLGHSDHIDRQFTAECYQLEELEENSRGIYKNGPDSRPMFLVCRSYEDVLICAALPGEVIFKKLLSSTLHTLIYLLLIEAAVLFLLNYLVRQKVVAGMHRMIESLAAITNGNLAMTVAVGGNREFEELSAGINTMVKSIIRISNRTSAIIEMSGIPLAAFEYERGTGHVFATSGLGTLLNIPNETIAGLCRNADQFDQYIRQIMQNSIEGEEDVYPMSDSKYVRIHLSEQQGKKLGVITDVTGDITEKNRMRYENTHDSLTELYKYQHFQRLAEDLLRTMPAGKICAAVMLDLDYFKGINDTFGHDVGDRYLQSFAAVMRAMPPEHCLPARRSGDEFCMLIFNCENRSDVIGQLEHFYEMLGKNLVALTEKQARTISASAGFVWTGDAGSALSELLSRADEALYQVKKRAKGTYGEYV